MSCTFSIVVPVYNVREYLDECMRSLLAQTYTDYEILLVDDGSTDGSGEACDGYKSEKCKVFHIPNSGPSEARNTAFRAAQGEYLVCVDSDDYITSDALEQFAAVVRKYHPDIVTANAYHVYFDGRTQPRYCAKKPAQALVSGREFYEQNAANGTMTACVWTGIYRREMVLQNRLFFKKGILHEDELWIPQVYYAAKSVACADFYFYYYRMRQGSITHQGAWDRTRGLTSLETCRELERFAANYPKAQSRWLRDTIAKLYMNATYCARLDKTDRASLDRFLPLRNACSAKNRGKAMLYALSPKLYSSLDSVIKGKNA